MTTPSENAESNGTRLNTLLARVAILMTGETQASFAVRAKIRRETLCRALGGGSISQETESRLRKAFGPWAAVVFGDDVTTASDT